MKRLMTEPEAGEVLSYFGRLKQLKREILGDEFALDSDLEIHAELLIAISRKMRETQAQKLMENASEKL